MRRVSGQVPPRTPKATGPLRPLVPNSGVPNVSGTYGRRVRMNQRHKERGRKWQARSLRWIRQVTRIPV